MMYVQSLTLEGCLHIHLLKSGKLEVFIEITILRGGPTSVICDNTNILEANPGPMCNLHKCNVET